MKTTQNTGDTAGRQPIVSSPANRLLPRLDRVRERGPGSWVACCPAHQDRTPSLSIRETTDGVVLLHCFSGCPTAAVTATVGLDVADLFPRPLDRCGKPHGKPPVPWRDVIKLLHHHLLVVAMAAADMADGKALSVDDLVSVQSAAAFLKTVLEEAGS